MERTGKQQLDSLASALLEIRSALLEREQEVGGGEDAIALSRRNLAHYMALRQHDIRPLQRTLERLGLSSLGRTEAHVLASLDAVIGVLGNLTGQPPALAASRGAPSFDSGQEQLRRNTEAVFGPAPKTRSARILVTLPSEASRDYALVRELLANGMNLARINCAHDDDASWALMIGNLERAKRELGRPCRVLMDIAGPKLRTGPLPAAPAVVKIKPERSVEGLIIAPARVILRAREAAAPSAGDPLIVPAGWLEGLRPGDAIVFEDLRGKRRELSVVEVAGGSCSADCRKVAYVGTSTTFRVAGREGARAAAQAEIEPGLQKLRLALGDEVVLTRAMAVGQAADPATGRAARIACTLPEVFGRVRAHHRVWFDDGKIGAVVVAAGADEVTLKITQAAAKGSKLAADKGINLPDTELRLPFLNDKDRADLRFVVKHASLAGLSYVQDPEDLQALSRELSAIGGAEGLALVLKIETRRAFERLPELLCAALGRWPVSVMIARGDLAIEIGYERLAEIQEEMLWICEAAHVPAIWATAVLETLAAKGTPTRAEITDAAMAQRAECVMLNKGPYVVSAIRVLDDILHRMDAHQHKKTSYSRSLRVSQVLAHEDSP